MRIECVARTCSQAGEGAVWDDRAQVLWWLDIYAGLIHRYDPSRGENRSFAFGEPVGSLAVRNRDGLVIAAKSGFWHFDPETGARVHLGDPESVLPANRFNDGTTDSQGRFWAGTMKDGVDPEPVGRFYRLDPDRSITPWRGGMVTPNGLAFSTDGRRMYFSDSSPAVRTIWACSYDPETGTPGEPRVFFDTSLLAGRPDGATVDAEDCYWVAGISGWQLNRISPEGDLLQTIEVPVEKPSKPMFGGPGLDILFFTSIALGITPGTERRQPDAGSLFAIAGIGIKGVQQTRFAG